MKELSFLILCWLMITAAGQGTRPPHLDGSTIPTKSAPGYAVKAASRSWPIQISAIMHVKEIMTKL